MLCCCVLLHEGCVYCPCNSFHIAHNQHTTQPTLDISWWGVSGVGRNRRVLFEVHEWHHFLCVSNENGSLNKQTTVCSML